jgi:hypothetical protein
VVSAEVALNYLPRYGAVGDSVTVSERPVAERTRIRIGLQGEHSLNPYFFGGGTDGRPLTSFVAKANRGETITRSVHTRDPLHTDVTMIRKGVDGSVHTRLVTFNTSVTPPVIERVTDTEEASRTGRKLESLTAAYDFVPCGGGMLARTVRQVSGPFPDPQGKADNWLASEWTSDDLGATAPGPDDFLVKIPETTRVHGLKSPPPTGTARTLNLAKIHAEDLIRPEDATTPLTAESGATVPGPPSSPGRAILIATSLALTAALCAYGVKRARSGRVRSR